MEDSVMRELRQIRKDHAAEFHNDVRAMVADYQRSAAERKLAPVPGKAVGQHNKATATKRLAKSR